jgi:hypothetical protein
MKPTPLGFGRNPSKPAAWTLAAMGPALSADTATQRLLLRRCPAR